MDLRIAEVNVTPGTYGTQVVGIVENNTKEEVTGPISVAMICFDDAGTAISNPSSYADGDNLPAGATASFSVDLFDHPCPNWAIGASGYS